MAVAGVPENRPNEGSVLDIKVDTLPTVSGHTITQFGADLSKAPVPDRKFTADVCSVLFGEYTVRLVFGQERIDGKGLRSAIVIQMSRASASNIVRMFDAMKDPSVDEIARLNKIAIEQLSTGLDEPPQALTVSANMSIIAISGHDACIDFYEASPFSLGVAIRSQKLALDPVVRIDLRASLVFGLMAAMRSHLTKELTELNKQLQGSKL